MKQLTASLIGDLPPALSGHGPLRHRVLASTAPVPARRHPRLRGSSLFPRSTPTLACPTPSRSPSHGQQHNGTCPYLPPCLPTSLSPLLQACSGPLLVLPLPPPRSPSQLLMLPPISFRFYLHASVASKLYPTTRVSLFSQLIPIILDFSSSLSPLSSLYFIVSRLMPRTRPTCTPTHSPPTISLSLTSQFQHSPPLNLTFILL